MIDIQLQDPTGNWRTYVNVINTPQVILMEMKTLAKRYPNQRVRAVNNNGSVVDIL